MIRVLVALCLFVTQVSAAVSGTWSGSGITISVEVDTDVRITLTGPNTGWYAVGFGGTQMVTTASAVLIESGKTAVEKVLGIQGAGTDPPAALTVVSDTVKGVNREVIVTRPIAGSSGTYSFPTAAGDVSIIWAYGAGGYAYHTTTRGDSVITFAVPPPPPPSSPVSGTWSGSGITISVEVDTDVRITLTGPNTGWYAVGFGGTQMVTTASAVLIESGKSAVEKVLGTQGAGTDPPAALTVVSDTVKGVNREVIVTRPIAGSSGTYSFPTAAGDVSIIWAYGAGGYAYHTTTRGDSVISFAAPSPPTAVPTKVPSTTAVPTAVPTLVPTAVPTLVPTLSPPVPVSTTFSGSTSSLGITVTVSITGSTARIQLSGPASGWYAVGFGGAGMVSTPSAVLIESGKTAVEKVLGSQTAGTDPPAALTVVSDTMKGVNREMVVTRAISGNGGTYTFPTTTGDIPVIFAFGTGAYSYHGAHKSSSTISITSFSSTGVPTTSIPLSDAPPTAVPTTAPATSVPTTAPTGASSISSTGFQFSDPTTGISGEVKYSSKDATIIISGAEGVWFGAAFGQQAMTRKPAATAFIVTTETPTKIEERLLGEYSAGTLSNTIEGANIVSDTTAGGVRTVQFLRSMTGSGSAFTFDTTATSVDAMVALGHTTSYSKHIKEVGLSIPPPGATEAPTPAPSMDTEGQTFSSQFAISSMSWDNNNVEMTFVCRTGIWCAISLGEMANGRAILCKDTGACEFAKLVMSGPVPETTQTITTSDYVQNNGYFSVRVALNEKDSQFVSGAPVIWGTGPLYNGNYEKHSDSSRGSTYLWTGGSRDGDKERPWFGLIAFAIVALVGFAISTLYNRFCKFGPDAASKFFFHTHGGTVLAMLALLGACLLASFANTKSEQWWYGAANAARLALSLTLILSCGSLGQIIRISRERLIKYHRWLGVAFIVFSLIHGIGYLVDSADKKILDLMFKTEKYNHVAPLYGVLSLGSALLMFLFTLIRRKLYHVFLYSHWIAAHLVVVFACLHATSMIIPVAAAVVYVAMFAIYKFIQPAGVIQEKVSTSDGQYTRLRIATEKRKAATYGSYYNIGFKGDLFHSHPFSVVKDGQTIDFIIKNMGTGTSTERIAQNTIEGDKVRLEGPFGVSTMLPYHFNRVLLCGGGVGVTPLLGIINLCTMSRTFSEYEMQTAPGDPNSAKFHLHWSVRDLGLVELAFPYLKEFGADSSVHVFLYYTGKDSLTLQLPRNVTVTRGRPNYTQIFGAPTGSLLSGETQAVAENVGVVTCGPEPMEKSVLEAIKGSPYKDNFIVHSETFLM
eukprot:TRINITY_DN860_c0_g1_i1.p1 TRINITY_DN860_c0_g1~~TRINITY_DN860_c0_g1_i1.p1  ORF type:complete len:1306 (+),score=223.47 TRINITY_DN860_c0_g1_i1:58-3975(+)